MDDAAVVGVGERIGELGAVADDLFDRQRPARDALTERLALDDFHRDVGAAIGFADIVNRADVRMVEGCRRARLSQQPTAPAWMLGQVCRQDLERDVAAQLRIVGAIHLAIPPAPSLE